MENVITSNLKSAYNNQYKDESSEWRELGALYKALNIIDITAGLKSGKVLEVGAGDGSILKFLEEKKYSQELFALEISQSGLDKIKSRDLPHLKEAQIFDGYKIPYPDKYFNLVILSHVLEHVEHERILLREIKRVSEYQVIEVPRDYRSGVDKKVNHFLSYGHINLYTPSSLKFLLRTEGFEVIKERTDVYDRKVFEFMAKGNFILKIKYLLAYYWKKSMMVLPSYSFKEKYCNTITLLLKAQKEELSIF